MQKQQHHGAIAEPTSCVKVLRIILIILNVIALILGIAALAIGIWSLSDDFGADNIEVIMETDLYTAVSILLVVGGSVVIITAFLGAFGAFFANRTMLGIYFGIMVFFCLIFVAGAIVGFFFLDEVEDSLATKMEDTLTNNYGVDVDNNERNKEVTTVWNDIQRKLKCCGVRGGLNSKESWFIWQSSEWFEKEGKAINPANNIYVPSSCCNTDLVFDNCQLKNNANNQPPKEILASVTDENPALYHTGCLDELEDKVNQHIAGIVTVAILIFVLIVACAVLSMLVCMEANKIGKVV